MVTTLDQGNGLAASGPPSFQSQTHGACPNSELTQVVFRATAEDLQHIAIITTQMRDQGTTFATRTDAVQHALKAVAAGAMKASTAT